MLNIGNCSILSEQVVDSTGFCGISVVDNGEKLSKIQNYYYFILHCYRWAKDSNGWQRFWKSNGGVPVLIK